MAGVRARLGAFGGFVGLLPFGLVALFTQFDLIQGPLASTVALLAYPVSILLAGGSAGYLVGQRRRKRSEAKIAIGAFAGLFAALIVGGALEALFLIYFFTTPPLLRDVTLGIHPLRVSFAIVLLSSLVAATAMITTYLTARPLPPARRLTQQIPAVPPPQRTREPYPPPRH